MLLPEIIGCAKPGDRNENTHHTQHPQALGQVKVHLQQQHTQQQQHTGTDPNPSATEK
jgi:hypothetical protein